LIDKSEKSRAYMIQDIKEFYINDTAQEGHAKFESSDYIHRATVYCVYRLRWRTHSLSKETAPSDPNYKHLVRDQICPRYNPSFKFLDADFFSLKHFLINTATFL